jgi:hypothetical protein
MQVRQKQVYWAEVDNFSHIFLHQVTWRTPVFARRPDAGNIVWSHGELRCQAEARASSVLLVVAL